MLVERWRGGYADAMSASDHPPASDRRRAYRHPIELKVEYKRLNTFFADYTKNISRGGTFIGTAKPLPIGTEFVFALEIPLMNEPLRLRGRVIWTTSTEDATKANPAGMGIEFQYSDDAERTGKRIHGRALDVRRARRAPGH